MSNDEELLCKTVNRKRVVFDPVNSHTATHFRDAPGLRVVAIEALSSMKLDDELIAKDIDMGRTIGNTDVVDVYDTDTIVYAIRSMREDQGYVPFTKSKATQPSSFISVHLLRRDDNTYELSSTWIGEFESPMFPQMDNATADSIPYWSTHAFVWGSQEIVQGSELSECPW